MLKSLKASLAIFLILCSFMGMAQTGNDFLDQVEAIRSINYLSGSFQERLYKFRSNFIKIHNFTLNYGSKLLDKISNGEQLNGHELNLIHESLSTYSFLVENSNEMLKEMAPKKKSHFLNSEVITKLRHDLQWIEFKSVLLQHFKNTYMVFYKNGQLRRIIKNQIRRENYQLEKFHEATDAILNRKYRRNLELGLKIFHKNISLIQRLAGEDPEANRLIKEIKDTIAYKLIKDGVGLKDFASQEGLRANAFDNLRDGLTGLTNGLSFAFGSVAGNISWRKGYLRNNLDAKSHILENLRPLDLLFEKRGYVFTDLTIPGNWGHVAVWLGTEEQLRELELWDHPAIVPHQDKIQKGYRIFQVRRWGLEFDTLDNFMNLDEIAIIRHKNVLKRTNKEIARVYDNLFDQIGKKYDFGFDAMTANEITCTEIITLSYGDVSWPTQYTFERITIAPDNMAEIAVYGNSPIEFVTYIRGDENLKANYLSHEQYGQTLGYRVSVKNDSPIFEKLTEVCKNIRTVNEDGDSVTARECKDEFLQPIYQGAQY